MRIVTFKNNRGRALGVRLGDQGDEVVDLSPAGVGDARRPPLWMKHGDSCEVEIEGIGLVQNPIEDEALK